MSGSRGWPSRPRGSGTARPNRRRWRSARPGSRRCRAYLLITRVEDEVRKGLAEGALGKGSEALVQALVDGGDGGGREGVAAQFLGDRLHLPCRDPLHIHLRQRRHQRLLGALVAFEELGGEPSIAILRHPQFK